MEATLYRFKIHYTTTSSDHPDCGREHVLYVESPVIPSLELLKESHLIWICDDTGAFPGTICEGCSGEKLESFTVELSTRDSDQEFDQIHPNSLYNKIEFSTFRTDAKDRPNCPNCNQSLQCSPPDTGIYDHFMSFTWYHFCSSCGFREDKTITRAKDENLADFRARSRQCSFEHCGNYGPWDWLEDFEFLSQTLFAKGILMTTLPVRGNIRQQPDQICKNCGKTGIIAGEDLECGHFYEVARVIYCPWCKDTKIITTEANYAAYCQRSFLPIMRQKLMGLPAGPDAPRCLQCGQPCHTFHKDLGARDFYDNTWIVCNNPDCDWSGEHSEEITMDY